MNIEPLTRIDQIQEGDALLISDGNKVISVTAKIVKVTDHDGTEVIFRKKKNKFFNVGMYLDGKSWAKDVRVVGA
jgi:hypothetical protein